MKGIRRPRSIALNGAVALLVIWLVLHALGWRECVSVLSGTLPDHWNWEAAVLAAISYLLAYFGVVLVAPALLLSVLFRWLWKRFRPD